MAFLPNIVKRVVYGPLPKPFAALKEPPLDFVGSEVMQPVLADYKRDKTAWRLNHLPLVVGQLRPEAMAALSGTATDEKIDISGPLSKPDFETCARQITRTLGLRVVSEELRQDCMQRNFVALWAGVAREILAKDLEWFGPATISSFTFHREVIVPETKETSARGRFTFAGGWHRDALSDDNGAISRLYLVRTSNPMLMLPNRLTEGIGNGKEGDITDPRIHTLAAREAKRPEAGQIVLINGGHKFGTAHAAYTPKPGEGGPSCFIDINCVL